MNYLDANFVTALHFNIRGQTGAAEKFVRKNSLPYIFSELFGTKLKAGTLDTLHVAHALHSGCTRFLSFDSDSNARVLAVSCRLGVYPELSAQEKARLVK